MDQTQLELSVADHAMPIRQIEVFFRGARPYIQGSLLIERAVASAMSELSAALARPYLAGAAFRKIVDHHCVAAWGTDASDPSFGSPLATITLADRTSSRRLELALHRDPRRASPPARHQDTPEVVTDLTRTGEGKTQAHFGADRPGLDALLRSVIELNKRSYELLFPGATGIMFSALFDSNLPTQDHDSPPCGTLAFELASARNSAALTSAISRTRLTGERDFAASLIFTFQRAKE